LLHHLYIFYNLKLQYSGKNSQGYYMNTTWIYF